MVFNPQNIRLLKAWAKVNQKILKESMAKRKVGNTGALEASLDYEVTEKAIRVMHNYYGIFPDMGAGRGMKQADVRTGGSKRKRKQWFTKPFWRDVTRLGDLMAQQFGMLATTEIEMTHSAMTNGTNVLELPATL